MTMMRFSTSLLLAAPAGCTEKDYGYDYHAG
jgi:hypothetical protein